MVGWCAESAAIHSRMGSGGRGEGDDWLFVRCGMGTLLSWKSLYGPVIESRSRLLSIVMEERDYDSF